MKRFILGMLAVILLLYPAAALDLSASTIENSNSGWLIANDGSDQTTITVTALIPGTPATPQQNAEVVFFPGPLSQDLGTISPVKPTVVKTDADGKATAIFRTSKKAGTAIINATVSFPDGFTTPVQLSTVQKIDHDIPHTAKISAPAELPVGTVTSVNVTVWDRWGNRVDNRNVAESLRLTMVNEGGAGLWDGANYVPQMIYTTDNEGNVTAKLRISTTIKDNYIQMDPLGSMTIPPDAYIKGVSGASSIPFFISQSEPIPDDEIPANGNPANIARIYYTITDKYNNPITGATVNCKASDGTSTSQPTNTYGMVLVTFGPKDYTGNFTLKASVPGNSSAVCKETGVVGYCGQNVSFYNTDPVDMVFSGSPLTMTSYDVKSSTRAILKARVIDAKGNPVIGQHVDFTLGTPYYPQDAATTASAPALTLNSADVADEGYATTEFIPGGFKKKGETGFNATAAGEVVVTAKWKNSAGTIEKTRTLTLSWKNYPYVSTGSMSNCGMAKVGDMVNVSIVLYGDGAALEPRPVDVMLVTDRSGSMLYDNPDRMYSVREASKTFVDNMATQDQIGLVSFGRKGSINTPGENSGMSSSEINNVYVTPVTYSDYATKDRALTAYASFSSVKSDLDKIVPDHGTPLRRALRLAIKTLLTDPNQNAAAVKAVVVLSDGDYNWDGDPLARGTGYLSTEKSTEDFGDVTWKYRIYDDVGGHQNMADYAAANNIKIYSIAFGDKISTDGKTALETLATTSNGKYYEATSSNVKDIYKAIAGDLRETAGGNTEIALDFGTVKINDVPSSAIGDYMEYVPDVHAPLALPTDSTYINKTNVTKWGEFNQLINISQNDKAAWDSHTMAFHVGTIKLNETWSATFRLQLKKEGNIDLFGIDNSEISFTDAATGNTQYGYIPLQRCFVKQSTVNEAFGSKRLFIENLTFTNNDPDLWNIEWNATYTGDETVQEAVLFRKQGDAQWSTVPGGLRFTSTQLFEEKRTFAITTTDRSLWPAGHCFDLQIVGGAKDANPSSSRSITKCIAGSPDTIYIKLD